jgi:hypothetical protein
MSISESIHNPLPVNEIKQNTFIRQGGDLEKNDQTSEMILNSINADTFRKRVEEKNEEFAGKVIGIISLLLFASPLIICDLYYGYTDNSCVNYYPGGLNINMKDYLLGCGYVSIIIILLIGLLTLSCEMEIALISVTFLQYLVFIFSLVWHIIGGVIFWGTLYKDALCDSNISTYLFVTLILKLISCYFTLQAINNKK